MRIFAIEASHDLPALGIALRRNGARIDNAEVSRLFFRCFFVAGSNQTFANQLGLVAAPPLFGLLLDIASSNYRPAWGAVGVVLLAGASRVRAGERRARASSVIA